MGRRRSLTLKPGRPRNMRLIRADSAIGTFDARRRRPCRRTHLSLPRIPVARLAP
jgi:hypothetical protein